MARLERFGRNTLPRPTPPGLVTLFLRQFLSPLIYILLIAAVVSVALQEWSDAIFIFAVLFINAVIGTIQEYSAGPPSAVPHPPCTQANSATALSSSSPNTYVSRLAQM